MKGVVIISGNTMLAVGATQPTLEKLVIAMHVARNGAT